VSERSWTASRLLVSRPDAVQSLLWPMQPGQRPGSVQVVNETSGPLHRSTLSSMSWILLPAKIEYDAEVYRGSGRFLDVSRTVTFPDSVSRTRCFPDKTFPGQSFSRTRRFPDVCVPWIVDYFPYKDVSRTITFPDRRFPDNLYK